jgi:small subunit ribosomal protein S13
MAVRIAGVDLVKRKKIVYALTQIYGIGLMTSTSILKRVNISPSLKVNELNVNQIRSIREILDKELCVEGRLRRRVHLNIKHLLEIKSLRGKRHKSNLPVRGQRTRTNAKTRRRVRK